MAGRTWLVQHRPAGSAPDEARPLVVERGEGEAVTVREGDEALAFTLRRLPDGALLVTTSDGRQRRIEALATATGWELGTGGRTWRFDVTDERDTWLQTGSGAGASGGDVTVSMPGRVVKVLVEADQHVDAGDPVLIIEAMKMENEVKAPIAGTVSRIAVAEGESVEADQLLLVIAPDE